MWILMPLACASGSKAKQAPLPQMEEALDQGADRERLPTCFL